MTSNLWGQTNDLDSIRWIRIYKSEINLKLFEFHGMNDSTLIGSIWKSAYYGEQLFFLESTDISDKKPSYFELFKFPQTDSLEVDSCITYSWDIYEDQLSNAIVFAFNDNNPMTDISGAPIIIDCGGGMLCFTYPPKTYTVTPILEINEIRIKEKLIHNKKTDEIEYVPIAIQLTPQLVSRMGSNIWIDLSKLRRKKPSIENHEWYDFIKNRNYNGIQYMQLKNTTNMH